MSELMKCNLNYLLLFFVLLDILKKKIKSIEQLLMFSDMLALYTMSINFSIIFNVAFVNSSMIVLISIG